MAHNLAVINGEVAFFGTSPAWHKLGTIVNEAQTWDQAMKLAHLDWTVSKHQLLSPINLVPVESWGIFRDDTNQMIGNVGSVYKELQNEFAFKFVDTLLEAADGAHYVTAGALGNGERIWCLAKFEDGFEVVPGDKHEMYACFTTTHDGSGKSCTFATDTRIVCQNTLNLAMGKNDVSFAIKHTTNAAIKFEQAKTLLTNMSVNNKTYKEKLRELSKRKLTTASITEIIEKLFKQESKVGSVLQYFESNDKNTFPEIRGTAYNLLNAVIEETDHNRKANAASAMFGRGAALKEQAFEVILECTSGAQRVAETTYFDEVIRRSYE